MSQAIQLIYPTIDLFLYDLHQGLGQSDTEINQNRQHFWQRIYGDSLNEEHLSTLQSQEGNFANYIELLGSQKIERFKHPLNGYYYPVKLGDTYALQIDYSGKKDDWEWEQLEVTEKLRDIKDSIFDHSGKELGKIGQSWLFWGQMTSNDQDPSATAQKCYEAISLAPQAHWEQDLQGKGKFQGATVFELEQSVQSADGKHQTHHMVMFIFPSNESIDVIRRQMTKLYPQLIRLFHNRNKILWVYQQSRQLKTSLKDSSSDVQQIVDSLPKLLRKYRLNLQRLQQDLADALTISYQHETSLSHLQSQISTIETNSKNYANRLRAISKQYSESNLNFFTRFYQYAQDKCLTQVNSDYQALSVGLKPLETFTKTVEGIIEIEKTKNERKLNKTLAVASVGIGAASLAAVTMEDTAQKAVQYYLPLESESTTPVNPSVAAFTESIIKPVHVLAPTVLTFSISIIVGLIFALITSLVVRTGK